MRNFWLFLTLLFSTIILYFLPLTNVLATTAPACNSPEIQIKQLEPTSYLIGDVLQKDSGVGIQLLIDNKTQQELVGKKVRFHHERKLGGWDRSIENPFPISIDPNKPYINFFIPGSDLMAGRGDHTGDLEYSTDNWKSFAVYCSGISYKVLPNPGECIITTKITDDKNNPIPSGIVLSYFKFIGAPNLNWNAYFSINSSLGNKVLDDKKKPLVGKTDDHGSGIFYNLPLAGTSGTTQTLTIKQETFDSQLLVTGDRCSTSYKVNRDASPMPTQVPLKCNFNFTSVMFPGGKTFLTIDKPPLLTKMQVSWQTNCSLDNGVVLKLFSPSGTALNLNTSPYFPYDGIKLIDCRLPGSKSEEYCDLGIGFRDDPVHDPLIEYGTYTFKLIGEMPNFGDSLLPTIEWVVRASDEPTPTPRPPLTPTPAASGVPGGGGTGGTTNVSAGGISCDPKDPGTIDPKTQKPTNSGSGIWTAIGCVPTEPVALISGLLKFAGGIGGGIALLLMVSGAFQMMTSGGNPDNLKKGHEQITSAAIGLLFIIFSVVLLRIIGIDILGFGGIGGIFH